MKNNPKKRESNWMWDRCLKNPPIFPWSYHRVIVCSLALFSVVNVVYWVSFLNSSNSSDQKYSAVNTFPGSVSLGYFSPKVPAPVLPRSPQKVAVKTSLRHIVFGIASSSRLWNHRKEYLKLWWRPNQMRGAVWLDKPIANGSDDDLLPSIKISSNTFQFNYEYPGGRRSALRISRIVSETLRLGFEDVRWLVMGDDDTFFVPDNLLSVLSKYDHTQYYYIGSSSESHTQNINFSYLMAYGGGGFAISYPLSKALAKMQDRCIQRHSALYGSDDRIQACMSELGVPLTKEPGFHQFDVYGNIFGLLTAHPIAPLVSLHHLDIVEPIFPQLDRIRALKLLTKPMNLDPAGLMQQTVCYDESRNWTVSVSWGYAVQIIGSIVSVQEMEIPTRTFLHWYRKNDKYGYSFNTRPVSRHVCEKPAVYYISNVFFRTKTNKTASKYVGSQFPNPHCKRDIQGPSRIKRVKVYKRLDPHVWERARRRNCCRVLPTEKQDTIAVDVGACKEDEIIELR
ncbi:hypothetical protein SLA2020_511640 [Shorea laevis]